MASEAGDLNGGDVLFEFFRDDAVRPFGGLEAEFGERGELSNFSFRALHFDAAGGLGVFDGAGLAIGRIADPDGFFGLFGGFWTGEGGGEVFGEFEVLEVGGIPDAFEVFGFGFLGAVEGFVNADEEIGGFFCDGAESDPNEGVFRHGVASGAFELAGNGVCDGSRALGGGESFKNRASGGQNEGDDGDDDEHLDKGEATLELVGERCGCGFKKFHKRGLRGFCSPSESKKECLVNAM